METAVKDLIEEKPILEKSKKEIIQEEFKDFETSDESLILVSAIQELTNAIKSLRMSIITK